MVYEIRSRRAQLATWLGDAPSRQALEVSVVPGAGAPPGSNCTEFCGFVPLSSLIERLSTSDDANFRLAEVIVVLKPRPDSPNSPLSGGATSVSMSQRMTLSVTIDASFDEGLADIAAGQLADLRLEAGPGKGGAAGLRSATSSPSHAETCLRHTSLVLGRDSLDEVSSEPGWPSDAGRMDVRVNYVCFDQSHASLYVNDSKTVYVTLATQQDGKDQQRTSGVGYGARETPSSTGPPGPLAKVMRASWKNEVITFDPLHLEMSSGSLSAGSAGDRRSAGGSSDPVETLRTSTDSHRSSTSSPLSPTSSIAKSPILRVGLWRTVDIVDQFQSFSAGDDASPGSLLIGSAVVVVTGALGEEEGVEIPLYDTELKKTGVVHLKIGTSSSKLDSMESAESQIKVGEQSRLNYEILSNMDALKRQVIPGEHRPGERHVSRRYAVSVSSDDSGACLGVAYDGAVSDVEEGNDDDGDKGHRGGNATAGSAAPVEGEERPRIINDDWMFSIEKSAV